MRRLAPLAFIVTAALSMSSIAGAQDIATASQPSPATIVTASVQAPAAGPTLDAATVGIHRDATQSATTPTNATPARHSDQPTALMIVGGAAFLAGAIIGGDAGTIIMVGGAAVGLYGLYLYLQ